MTAAIKDYWNRTLKEEAVLKKSLRFLNLEAWAMGFSHPVWICSSDPMQAVIAATKAQLLEGSSPLTGHKCAGKKQHPLCNTSSETTTHFLIDCSLLPE